MLIACEGSPITRPTCTHRTTFRKILMHFEKFCECPYRQSQQSIILYSNIVILWTTRDTNSSSTSKLYWTPTPLPPTGPTWPSYNLQTFSTYQNLGFIHIYSHACTLHVILPCFKPFNQIIFSFSYHCQVISIKQLLLQGNPELSRYGFHDNHK